MTGNVTVYTDLITSEHADKANFTAAVAAACQPFADILAEIETFPGLYDLDEAVGEQLDATGLWIGRTRFIALPNNIYFSLDTNGLGFDQGIWFVAYDPATEQFALPDDHYRLLLQAKVLANQWDGSIPGAYAAWEELLGPYGNTVLIQDNQNMTMTIGILGPLPDPLTTALITGGYLTLVPCGVGVLGYFVPSMQGTPFFGMDASTSSVAGFNIGSWGTELAPGDASD